MPACNPEFVTHRNHSSKTAIIFIHGFCGHAETTWSSFLNFLANDNRISDWDIFSLGYISSMLPDLTGIWKADPPILSLADGLRTAVDLPPFRQYKSLALIAHSMGGLVVQRALVDDNKFASRIGHVFFFGTPSGGLRKASHFKFWKRQLDNMAEDGSFVKELRSLWKAKFIDTNPPFKVWAVAGDQDEFVPRTSSIEPFHLAQRAVVPGDHLSIVKPSASSHRSVQIVLEGLTEGAASAGPWNSACLPGTRRT